MLAQLGLLMMFQFVGEALVTSSGISPGRAATWQVLASLPFELIPGSVYFPSWFPQANLV
jgi:hypothetical protein